LQIYQVSKVVDNLPIEVVLDRVFFLVLILVLLWFVELHTLDHFLDLGEQLSLGLGGLTHEVVSQDGLEHQGAVLFFLGNSALGVFGLLSRRAAMDHGKVARDAAVETIRGHSVEHDQAY